MNPLPIFFSNSVSLTCARMIQHSIRESSIPNVTIKTGIAGPDGREEMLTEYICDHPGCPNVATNLLGVVVDVCAMSAVCDEHAPKKHRT